MTTPAFRLLLLVALLAMLPTVGMLACANDADKREDLRDESRDAEVPKEQRVERLRTILADETEDPHRRATAIQMLAELGDVDSVPAFLRLLGVGSSARHPSTAMRMEAVMAIVQLGTLEQVTQAAYRVYPAEGGFSNGEPDPVVRRQFLQAFRHRQPGDTATAELLLRMLRFAIRLDEQDSLIWTLTHQLQRIAERDTLGSTQEDLELWDEHIAVMRARDRGQVDGGDTAPIVDWGARLNDLLNLLRRMQIEPTLSPADLNAAYVGSDEALAAVSPGDVAQDIERLEVLQASGQFAGPRDEPYTTDLGTIRLAGSPPPEPRLRIVLADSE